MGTDGNEGSPTEAVGLRFALACGASRYDDWIGRDEEATGGEI
jgi:hypothetical protein